LTLTVIVLPTSARNRAGSTRPLAIKLWIDPSFGSNPSNPSYFDPARLTLTLSSSSCLSSHPTSRSIMSARPSSSNASSSSSSLRSTKQQQQQFLPAAERLAPHLIKHNVEQIFFIRTFVSIIGGCCCGILGLTNWDGFAFYLFTAALTAIVCWMKMGGKGVKTYFTSASAFTVDGLVGACMSYVLFWTLLYDIVYVY